MGDMATNRDFEDLEDSDVCTGYYARGGHGDDLDIDGDDLGLDAVPMATTPSSDDLQVTSDVMQEEEVARRVSRDGGSLSVQVNRVKGGDVVIGDKVTQHVRYDKLVKKVYRQSAGYEQVKDQSRADLKNEEQIFVETHFYREAVESLQQNGVLLISGPPGSGKTTLARALLRSFEIRSFTPLILHRHSEWRQYVGAQKMVVLLDNIFGDVCVNHSSFAKWSKSFACISEFAKESKCLTVFTMYTHIFRELEASGNERKFFQDIPVLDLGASTCLSLEERTTILKRHLETSGETVTESDLMDILSNDMSGPVFPWCSRRYALLPADSAERARVFTTPELTYVTFLIKAASDSEYGYLTEAMLRMTFKGCCCSRTKAREELQLLGHASSNPQQLQNFVRHFSDAYFSSQGLPGQRVLLQDVAALTLGATDLTSLLEMCTLKSLIQYIHTEDSSDRIYVKVSANSPDYEILHHRFHDEVSKGSLPVVVQHPSLQSCQYLSDFAEFLVSNDSLEQVLLATDPECGQNLMYWSAFSTSSALSQWCVEQMQGQKLDKTQISTCLLRMMFLCALSGDDELYSGIRRVASSVKPLRSLSGLREEMDLYFLSKEQQCTISAQTKCQRFYTKAHSGTLRYLDDQSLLLPPSIFGIETSGVTARLIFPTKQWYLALRLLADRQVDERDEEGNTLLHVAADTGDLDVVKIAVKSGASLTVLNDKEETPVHVALNRRQNSTEVLKPSLQKTRAFHKLCADGEVEKAKVLLCYDASVDDRDSSGQAALHVASQAGQKPVVDLLLQVGASVRSKTKEGSTALHSACGHGHEGTAALLIAHGALVNLKDFSGRTPLHVACVSGHADTAALLLHHHAQVNNKNHEGFTPLQLACRKGHQQTAELLIRHGANVNSQNCFASTPLHYACSSGHRDIAVLLLDHGANVSAKTTRGSTPLHLACQEGHAQIAELLIERHAGVNVKNESGSTPLHAACFFERRDVINLLLQHGADPRKKNEDGYTPLHLACERGDRHTADLLIQHGADVQSSGQSGFTALHYASYYGHVTTTALLLQHHADVGATTKPNRCTPLSLAAQRGHRPIVEQLIKHNADVNEKDRAGLRPLDRARKNGHVETAAFLLQNGAKSKRRHLSFASVVRRKEKK